MPFPIIIDNFFTNGRILTHLNMRVAVNKEHM